MNRWILRGLTVAGFTAGAWLLGNAAAYAADTSADTTATITVDVHLGTLAPSATPILHRVAATAATATALTRSPATRPAAHVHAVPAAAASTTAPVATDAALGACADVALNTEADSCTAGPAAGDPGTANSPGAVPAGAIATQPPDAAAPAAFVSGIGNALVMAGTGVRPGLSGPGILPRTGADTWSLVGAGVVLLLLGVALRSRTT